MITVGAVSYSVMARWRDLDKNRRMRLLQKKYRWTKVCLTGGRTDKFWAAFGVWDCEMYPKIKHTTIKMFKWKTQWNGRSIEVSIALQLGGTDYADMRLVLRILWWDKFWWDYSTELYCFNKLKEKVCQGIICVTIFCLRRGWSSKGGMCRTSE